MSHQRHTETQRRLKKKYVESDYCNPITFDEEKGIYRRYYFGKGKRKGRRRFIKRQSARYIRRRVSDVSRAKGYDHKHYDFWWELI